MPTAAATARRRLTNETAAINANAVAGFCGFAAASVACLYAASIPRRAGPAPLRPPAAHAGANRSVSLWQRLAALHAVCALEIVLDLRYRGHDVLVSMLEQRGWYGARSNWQGAAVLAALATAAALTWLAARRRRGDRAAIGAILGTACALALFAVEAISLHRVDALMYASAGPLLVLAWLWLGASATVIASALAAAAASRARTGTGTRAASPGDGA